MNLQREEQEDDLMEIARRLAVNTRNSNMAGNREEVNRFLEGWWIKDFITIER